MLAERVPLDAQAARQRAAELAERHGIPVVLTIAR